MPDGTLTNVKPAGWRAEGADGIGGSSFACGCVRWVVQWVEGGGQEEGEWGRDRPPGGARERRKSKKRTFRVKAGTRVAKPSDGMAADFLSLLMLIELADVYVVKASVLFGIIETEEVKGNIEPELRR